MTEEREETRISPKMSVGGLAARHPHTRAVFEVFGVDYCCGGARTLEVAAEERGVDLEKLLHAIEEAVRRPEPKTGINWMKSPLTHLVDHIEERHHMYLKEHLPRLQSLVRKLIRTHGRQFGTVLVHLEELFDLLKAEVELHLFKEEHILFPHIRRVEAYAGGRGTKPEFHCDSIENPLHQMEHEHKNASEALKRIRRLTSNYALPKDAPEDSRELYEGLRELEEDLHLHIHLENNILFPRAIEAEKSHAVRT